METIKVYYRPLAPGFYHKDIIYTNSTGHTYVAQAAINRYAFIPVGIATFISANLSIATLAALGGLLKTNHYEVDPNIVDNGDYSEEIISSEGSLLSYWNGITSDMDAMNSNGWMYLVAMQNSNTAVDHALSQAGLPQPQQDDVGEHDLLPIFEAI